MMIQDRLAPKLLLDVIGNEKRAQGVCHTSFEYLLVILL